MATGLENISFDEEFFCDEIRNGFFISETMKRFWAAQLKVLSEIDKVCRSHNCRWFADCGTLLGAVRHNGFVPWDDDVDIIMPRDDLEVFLGYAKKELPKGFCILSVEDNEDYDELCYRIVNNNGMDARTEFTEKYFGCPFAVGVDINVLDRIYKDEQTENDRCIRGNLVLSTIRGVKERTLSDQGLLSNLRQIEADNGVSLNAENVCRELISLFYDITKECTDEDCEEVAVMKEWIPNRRFRFPASWYDKWEEIPFESVKVRVPSKYDEILTAYYGEYMVVRRGASAHDYPLYRKQENVYRNLFGTNPDRFFFDINKFSVSDNRQSFQERQLEIMGLMRAIHGRLHDFAGVDNTGFIMMLQNLQDAAVGIGNAIEGRFGSDLEAVHILEKYCEAVYEAANSWEEGAEETLNKYITDAERSIKGLFAGTKKQVLFLLCRSSWWDSLKSYFREMVYDDNYEVRAMPIPYYFHNNYNMIGEARDDTCSFEKKEELRGYLTDAANYDLKKIHPDVVVIQFPYDQYSRAIGIPRAFHTTELLEYTDKLVYVPYLSPSHPASENDVAFRAMRELVEQPAVFNADQVITRSEGLRNDYINILVGMTGEEVREYWEKRIV